MLGRTIDKISREYTTNIFGDEGLQVDSMNFLESLEYEESCKYELLRILATFDSYLASIGVLEQELTVCGKGALVLKEYTEEETQDIDVVDVLPRGVNEIAASLGISNQASQVIECTPGLLSRRERYPCELSVVRLYLLSDTDLLLCHLSRNSDKDIYNITNSSLVDRVTPASVYKAVVDYPQPKRLLTAYESLFSCMKF